MTDDPDNRFAAVVLGCCCCCAMACAAYVETTGGHLSAGFVAIASACAGAIAGMVPGTRTK